MDFRGKNIDIVGKQNIWFAFSIALILIGLVSWRAFGLNYGIDFAGGGQIRYLIPLEQRPAGNDIELLNATREALAPKGLESAQIQISGGDTLVITTDATDSSSLESQEQLMNEALTAQFGSTPEVLGRELVGPVIGRELKKNAFLGVFLGVICIGIWIYIRYNFAGAGWHYSLAGIMALVHDVLVMVGMFALIGYFDPRIQVDGTFIAALLTVVGYSINDSVIIFDRIRENMRKRRRDDFNKVVNDSLLETMSRSINTGMTVFIMLVAMLLLGGESIYNFILAMLIGIAIGLYSSIFHASMILTVLNQWLTKAPAGSRAARGASTLAAAPSAPAAKTVAKTPSTPAAASPSTPTDTEISARGPAARSDKARSRRRF